MWLIARLFNLREHIFLAFLGKGTTMVNARLCFSLSLVTNADIKVDWFTLHRYDALHYGPKHKVKIFMWQTGMSNPGQAQAYQ